MCYMVGAFHSTSNGAQLAKNFPSALTKSSFHVDPVLGHFCQDEYISPLSRFFVVFNYSTFVVWPATLPFASVAGFCRLVTFE